VSRLAAKEAARVEVKPGKPQRCIFPARIRSRARNLWKSSGSVLVKKRKTSTKSRLFGCRGSPK
jgi:hypothetical protein